jgi:hypothetical protein
MSPGGRWVIILFPREVLVSSPSLGPSGLRENDDEYKPVWPSGLWATSQADETSKAYNRTQPLVEAFSEQSLVRSVSRRLAN